MIQRFPDIDWFCDNCGAYLNGQKGFDDRKYIWKCKKCGFKNSISEANIRYEDPFLFNVLGFLLGYFRSLSLLSLLILATCNILEIGMPVFIQKYNLLYVSLGTYPILMLLSLYFERSIAKYGIHKPLMIWVITTIPINIFNDILRPFQEALSFPFAWIKVLRLKRKDILYKKYIRKKSIYGISYILLLVVLIYICIKAGLTYEILIDCITKVINLINNI